MTGKLLIGSLATALVLAATPSTAPAARADSVTDLSGGLSEGVALSVSGGATVLAASGIFVVVSAERLADGLFLLLRNAADGSRAALRLSGQASRRVAIAVGDTVTASPTAAGVVLTAAGKVIAFVPDAASRALLHESPYAPAGGRAG